MNFKSKSNYERNWNVISPNEKQAISVGDVLKLGRVRLKIDRIYSRKHVEDTTACLLNHDYSNHNIKNQLYFVQQIKDKNLSQSNK